MMAIVFPEKLDSFIRLLLNINCTNAPGLDLVYQPPRGELRQTASTGPPVALVLVKNRIAPAYTWLCQFVQALLALVLFLPAVTCQKSAEKK
ncbi:MAG: hypothetical protein EBZ11_07255 [Alphaproteobacteria bacterium]|nr:hypothetical protein [Alphaproteobacteria bacterium]